MQKLGASVLNRDKSKVVFRTLAFEKPAVTLLFVANGRESELPMVLEQPNIFSVTVEGQGLDLRYKFRLPDDGDFPDPYSNYQPSDVHGYSQVVDHSSYTWGGEDWKGRDPEDLIIYELHIGTFTPEGTFRSAADKLDYLQKLGVTSIEVMPVTQVPGRFNWGYDGVLPFSVNNNYGTPEDFKYLVDQCHLRGLSVILDVVYNHLGPEGNYLQRFGPYFTGKHETPWGAAINFDDAYFEYTRDLILTNITYWVENYRIDGFRIDGIEAIKDDHPPHILQEIAQTVRNLETRYGRKLVVIAESDDNDVRIINPVEKGGYGLDAQWMNDFHHCIHAVLTGESRGYYTDYGRIEDFEKVFKNYLYTGEYSKFFNRNRGTDASANPGRQFVVATQTHDQVGNRGGGERLIRLVGFRQAKLAAGLVLLSAYIPLIFMGEEYGEENPFLFFVDFTNPDLKKAATEGRKWEYSRFEWTDFPDPTDPETFNRSKLTPGSGWSEQNWYMHSFYRDLISLRQSYPALKSPQKNQLMVEIEKEARIIRLYRWSGQNRIMAYFNLGKEKIVIDQPGEYILNSEWEKYGGREKGRVEEMQPGGMAVIAY